MSNSDIFLSLCYKLNILQGIEMYAIHLHQNKIQHFKLDFIFLQQEE